MIAAILNSAILNLAILDSAILVFPLKLTHTCQDWFPPFAQKKLHSFILTQLDDGGHLEFCHFGFSLCHVGFRYLVFFSQIHSKTLTPLWLWLKLIQSDSNSFILTQLDDGSHLEFHHLWFSHCSFSSQTHSHLPRLVPTICTKKNFTHTSLPNLEFGAHQGPGPSPPSHPPPPWQSPRVISPLSHFVGPHYLWLKNHQDIVLTH